MVYVWLAGVGEHPKSRLHLEAISAHKLIALVQDDPWSSGRGLEGVIHARVPLHVEVASLEIRARPRDERPTVRLCKSHQHLKYPRMTPWALEGVVRLLAGGASSRGATIAHRRKQDSPT